MSKLEYGSQKFLYKIQKWGRLHPDVSLILYTDHKTQNTETPPLFDYTIFAVVGDCFDFTRKLDWINYFGQSKNHDFTESVDNHIIEVDYDNGPLVKFILLESNLMAEAPHKKHATILVDRKA